MSVVVRVVAALRQKPMTRPELSALIDNVTSRAIRHQLKNLEEHGFVRHSNEARRVYRLDTEEGLWVECCNCRGVNPCWTIRGGVCRYCRNMRWLIGDKKNSRSVKSKDKEDAQARMYHSLLRGAQIGGTKTIQKEK